MDLPSLFGTLMVFSVFSPSITDSISQELSVPMHVLSSTSAEVELFVDVTVGNDDDKKVAVSIMTVFSSTVSDISAISMLLTSSKIQWQLCLSYTS
jgi:hypothetical protein